MAQSRARRSRVTPNQKLIVLRVNRGLSPNRLASLAGVSGNTVRAAEGGEWINEHSQHAIAQFFDLDPIELFPLETQRRFV